MDADTARALQVARALVAAGVPLFVAPPHTDPCVVGSCKGPTSTGFHLPVKWETSTPTASVVDRWRSGWALCAVMGHVVDLADVDPRNGGSETLAGLQAAGAWPRSYGRASTPSGGTHDLIAALHVGSHDNIAPGLDIKGGKPDGTSRGFAFIAPTVKASKTTGKPAPYRWLDEPDLSAISADDDTGATLAEMVGRAGSGGRTMQADDDEERREHTGPMPEGDRYPALRSYAGKLLHDAPRLGRAEYEALCRLRWQACEQPPKATYEWTWAEALANPVRDLWERYRGKHLAAEEFVDSLPDAAPLTADERHAIAVEAEARKLRIRREAGRLVDAQELTDPADASTAWEPIDLEPYLDGSAGQPAPTVGVRRRDGLRLLYAAREHTVMGEMESGKTWFAAACVAAELDAGNHVLYVHFEESDPADLVGRLRALGVPVEVMRKRLRFVAPDRPVSADALRALLDPAPSLVVLDGVNEGMSLHGQAIREEDGASRFRRALVAPCLRAGAATLGCDHVVKDQERRGRTPLGSIHKGNAVNGSLILLENVEAFGRGQRGVSHVFVTKDRPGHLRRHGQPGKVPGKTYLGTLVVDDSQTESPDLELFFWPPPQRPATRPVDPQDEADAAVLAGVRRVIETGAVANLRTVRAASGLRHDETDQALARLTLAGRLIESEGKRGARVFTVPQDQSSGSAP